MSRSGARHQHNLPASRGRLIGRERELAAVRQAMLRAEGRLVSLTGAGGCGKTRLALQLATDLVGHFPDGVWLVELAQLAEPSLVPQAIATTLNVAERRGRAPLASLVAALANRHILLVLDNCEHLIDACAQAVETLLKGCPRVHVLTTSREQLRIADEVRWPVPPLALPDPRGPADAVVSCAAAVQLFVDRAQAVSPDFAPTARNTAIAGQICTRLGGLPLAIELAAAHVRTLGIDQIAERLQDSFQLLVGGSRTAPARQQTLRATLDWSHDLLSESERMVLRRLAVFAGTWSVETAEAVCADGADRILDSITRLVDLSVVVAEVHNGRARYHLLEPVRQYALERLAEHGELETIRQRHALAILSCAEQLEATATVGGPRRQAACEALDQLYPNLQVGLRWCLDRGDAETAFRLARAVHFVWTTRRPPSEGLGWLRLIFDLPGRAEATPARALAYVTAGRLATQQGSYAEARAFFDTGLPLARQAGDPFVLLAALQLLAVDCVDRGAYAEGRVCLDEALALALARGDRLQETSCRNNLVWLACLQGDYPTACRWSDEAIRLARTLGDDWTLSWPLQALGFAACAQGDLTTARAALAETERLWQHVGELYGMAWTQEGLGHVALAEHKDDEAEARFRDTLALRQELGDLPGIADCLEGIGGLLAMRTRQKDAVRLAGAAESAARNAALAARTAAARPARSLAGPDAHLARRGCDHQRVEPGALPAGRRGDRVRPRRAGASSRRPSPQKPAHATRARRRGPGRQRHEQSPDRRAAGHRRAHRCHTPRAHPGQARLHLAHADRHLGRRTRTQGPGVCPQSHPTSALTRPLASLLDEASATIRRTPQCNACFNLALAGPWGPSVSGMYVPNFYPTQKPTDFDAYRSHLQANLAEPGRMAALRGMANRSDAAVEARLAQVSAPTPTASSI